jgi:hypothetical protein
VSKITWDNTGERRYETGVDRGVLYLPNTVGVYDTGVGWNGLTKVTEKPTGATPTPLYADNIKYLNLISTEYFEADVSAYTYPEEFAQCDGSAEPEVGVAIGQQPRKSFGLCYRTKVGNDLEGTELGYKLHMVYGAYAAPSQKDFATINDSPTAIEFSWSVTTTPVNVTGYKPTATLTIDSTKVDAGALATLEGFLYGTTGTDPSLPTPDAVLAIFAGTVTVATPVAPTYTAGTHTINIPTVTGITYYIHDLPVTGGVVISADTVVTAAPNTGYKFPDVSVDEWLMPYS